MDHYACPGGNLAFCHLSNWKGHCPGGTSLKKSIVQGVNMFCKDLSQTVHLLGGGGGIDIKWNSPMASESSSSLATSHEVDAVSSLDESLGDEESSSSVAEGAPNAVVSLLSRLKSLRLSDFARKRKVVTNPPTGKCPCHGSTAAELNF